MAELSKNFHFERKSCFNFSKTHCIKESKFEMKWLFNNQSGDNHLSECSV